MVALKVHYSQLLPGWALWDVETTRKSAKQLDCSLSRLAFLPNVRYLSSVVTLVEESMR